MATLLYRFKATSPAPIAAGDRKIEVKMLWDRIKVPIPAGNLTLSVDGQEVAGVRVEKSCRLLLDASETFDVGMDLGAPASRDYDGRTPFAYTGKITSLN